MVINNVAIFKCLDLYIGDSIIVTIYTQATSICLIQSEVTELNSRKTTKWNSELFPSCLT
ncbi:hypothetical protein CTM83_17715 [Photobacterium leiognathi subsp. mandapamensis]|nr:hypothetical protein CTM83_17715 [Photobacterium leiognathi subsp. mandapamensis]